MAVTPDNVDQMPDMVDIAAQYGISNIHYLWMFAHGKADKESLVPVDRLFARLREADRLAVEKDIAIDNIQAIEKQVFSPQGTRHDLGSAGWESLAIGPDGRVYPTPALIRESEAVCGHAGQGLETVWRQSELLDHIRGLTLVESSREHDPLKFIVGGGDLDHSFYHGRAFMGHDPYIDLYRRLALWLMARGAGNNGPAHIGWPCVLVRMGDRLLTCDDAHGEVALTHSNCVLSISTRNAGVQTFYGNAADAPNLDIANPVCYPEEEISHVPQEARVRSYGCGSPVLDAGIRPGQTLVDLGSGAGMECFVAARKVGKTGRVFGIDMTDPMLAMARKSLEKVEMALSYQNIEFKKSFLEDLPLDNDSVDIVISNCVINLSGDKHQTFREIHRILKPGGRLVISDIVTDTVPDPVILNDPRLRGECIAGALTTPRLLSLLEIAGFENTCILKRFFYREVRGHAFFSITYEAHKPIALADQKKKQVLYPGPFAAVITDEGRMLVRGRQEQIPWPGTAGADLFVLDDQGNVANMDMENSCSCTTPPEARDQVAEKVVQKMSSGCMTCGKPLQYFTQNRVMACRICGREKPANAMCEDGHFVCDACHSKDAFDIVTDLCLGSRETDMIKLFNRIRRHPAVPLHGPEHHFAVPGAITAAYRNLGGAISDDQILSALERGKAIPGGVCAFWGGCGAALGVGIAFGIILESTPVKAGPRQTIQQVTGKIIERLGEIAAARCCQRESWTALIIASQMSQTILPIAMPVDTDLACTQAGQNRECPGRRCPYFKTPEPVLFHKL
jgi:SAM-dependent methyltransferase